jgi:hypothetical protein
MANAPTRHGQADSRGFCANLIKIGMPSGSPPGRDDRDRLARKKKPQSPDGVCIGMKGNRSSPRLGLPRSSRRRNSIGEPWSARFHKNRPRRFASGLARRFRPIYATVRRARLQRTNTERGNSSSPCASNLRCGAIGTVHTESAAAYEKTCARFAIAGSSLRTWETPDSFARGAAGALRVGFQPTERVAAAPERARRRAFANVTDCAQWKARRFSSRTRFDGARARCRLVNHSTRLRSDRE